MLITPYLPKEAEVVARGHIRDYNQPAFVVAIEYNPEWLTCPNCNDIGAVYLRICKKGPYRAPLSDKIVYTWFDGDGRFGKGWYIVDSTLAFVCPECNGIARETGEPITPERIIELKAMETNLVRRLK